MLPLRWAVLFFCWQTMYGIFAAETNHLSYYETLSQVHVSSHAKRSSRTQGELVKWLQFHAFQRNFHLTLKSGAWVLAKDFRAHLKHKDGSSTTLPLDQSKIFTGHDTYNVQSAVHAYLEESLWSIQIIEENEIYVIEPAWRILRPFENPYNDTMVAYRMSDLKDFTDRHQMCRVSGKKSSLNHQNPYHNKSKSSVLTYLPHPDKRNKRSLDGEICLMHLVGDTSFFKQRCRSNHFACLSLMVHHLQFADEIYRTSPFEDKNGRKFVGMGVQVAELVLLTDYTTPGIVSRVRHFNEKYNKWTADSKLLSFAKYMSLAKKRYCLNHLFTEFSDQQGVLGLAYVNTLCKWWDPRGAFNSGITSGTNRVGFLLPTLVTSLVFSHEMGHNFGSHHDPDTPKCAPRDSEGGKFLMWEFAVQGQFPNNKLFSICSLREIGRMVPAGCFVARSKPYSLCGNGLVDAGEECDAGFFGSRGDNKCCSKHCTLRPGAICSEINHECCVNCQIASATTVCRDTVKIFSCRKRSYCSGKSLECKDGGFLADGSECGEMHKCYDGVCVSPCGQESRRLKTVDLKPCLCKENASAACMWCCFDATDRGNPGKCQPLLPMPRNNGTACYRGACQDGVCLPDIRKQSRTQLEAYIEFVKTSDIDGLLRTNIVLIVVFSTLIFWVPASLWISSLDRKERRQIEKSLEVPTINDCFEGEKAESSTTDGVYYDDDEDEDDDDNGTDIDETQTVVSFYLDIPHAERYSKVSSQGGFSRKLRESPKVSLESTV